MLVALSNTVRLLLISLCMAFALAAWHLPDHYLPWLCFNLEFAAFCALWLFLVYVTAFHPTWPLTQPYWIFAVLAIAAIPLLQAASGLLYFPQDGWIAAVYIAGFALSCGLGYAQARLDVPRFAQQLAWLFVAGAGLSAAIAFYQLMGLEYLGYRVYSLPPDWAPYGNFAQPNHLATLLCMGLGSVLYLHMRGQIRTIITCLIGVLLIMALVISESRTPWISFVSLLGWYLWKARSIPQLPGRLIVGGSLLYVAMLLLWPLLAESLGLTVIVQEKTLHSGFRTLVWPQLINAAWQSPWWGYGWGQVGMALSSVVGGYETSMPFTHSHNILIDLLIWNGIPIGGGIILLSAVWLLRRGWTCRSPESWYGLLVVGVILIHALLEYTLEFAYFLIPTGLLLGLVYADQVPGPAPLRIPRVVMIAICVVSVGLLAAYWRDYQIIERDHRLMRFEVLRIGDVRAAEPAPRVRLLGQLAAYARFMRVRPTPGMTEQQLEWMRQVAYRYPQHLPSLYGYALALALNGKQAQAGLEMRKLRILHGQTKYEFARAEVRTLAATRYPQLRNWQLP